MEEKTMHDILFENLNPDDSILSHSIQGNKRPAIEQLNSGPTKQLKMKKSHIGQISNSTTFSSDEIMANLKEECSTFGQHIANKLLKYSSRTRAMVEHAINNIIFEADIGKYDEQGQFGGDSSATVSTSYQHVEPDTLQTADFIKIETGDV